MKKLVVVTILFWCFHLSGGFAQCWERSYTPLQAKPDPNIPYSYQLSQISFIDDSIGWVAGIDYSPIINGQDKVGICKTVDGGKTWKKQKVDKYSEDFEPMGLAFSGRDTGWLVGFSPNVLFSIDGGNTWDLMVDISKLWSGVSGGIANIFLQDGRTVWFFDRFSSEAVLFHTNNFGKTWDVKFSGIKGSSLYINSKGIGWADNNIPVLDKERLNKTTDNGETFQQVLNPKGGTSKLSFHGDYGVVFNTIGTKILTTNDYGNNWDSIRLGPDSLILIKREKYYTGVDKIDSNEIIISGFNRYNLIDTIHFEPFILKSYNNGKTWRKQKMNNSSPYRLGNIKYINRNFAVAVGDSNQVYIYRRPPAPTCDLKILSSDTINSNELLKWSPASGCIGGYYLSIGTAPNKKDILDSLDVEDVLQYNLSKLQTKQNIYITLTPYNDGGVAPTCNSKKIYYNQCTLTTRIDTMIKQGVTIEGVIYTKDTVITKAYKSLQGCDSLVSIYVDVLTSNQDLPTEFIQSLTVAPNPTAGNLQVTFQLKSATSGKLYITDRLGRTLWQSENKDWSTGQQTLDLEVSKYPSGVYQLHWQSNRSRSVVSWMKGG